MKKGNAGDSRFASIEDFSPRTEIKGKDGKSKKITIDAGAFYTNTTSKQCVIRMCSGVDIKDDEETIKSILEDTQFEKARDLTGAGLAIRYILEGGVPAKNIDFTKNISKEEGKKEYGRDFSQGIGVIPRGRGNRGFGKNYGSTYGDPYLRSDAADGFGIVPMPGIVDADIRTKTAYGSLREAKVNFVCHNRRQLEVLELLYMRPGYPLLLEWGWDPFINNEGKRESYFPYINEWFEEGSNINQINAEIVRRKKVAGGNYDGFVGFVKNFEITSRDDGGYNCSTELVAMGEALDGLKGRRSGFEIYNPESKEFNEVDDFEFILTAFKDIAKISYLDENATEQSGKGIGEVKAALENTTIPDFIIALRNVGLIKKTPKQIKDLETSKTIADEYNLASDRDGLTAEEKQRRAQLIINSSKELREAFKNYFIFNDGPLTTKVITKKNKGWESLFGLIPITEKTVSKSGENYVRWDFIVSLLNLLVIDRYQENISDPKPITEFTVLRDSISKNNPDTREYLEYTKYKLGVKNGDAISDLVDSSVDLSICILPHQIPDIIEDISPDGKKTNPLLVKKERSIGLTYINIDHLFKTYKSMRYNSDGTNDDFSIIDYVKRIWEQDINDACAGTHNFMLQTEQERPNVLRIIDLQSSPPENLQPENLFEFKIQSNEAIVRDFNFNTTIPSALSSTVAIAAQSPGSVSDLDQVTFKKFNKYTSYRFNNTEANSQAKKPSQKDLDKKAKALDKEIERLNTIIKQLATYQRSALFGEKKDDAAEGEDLISLNQAKGYIKGLENKIISIQSKYQSTLDVNNGPFKGFPKLTPNVGKSAVIPLKFNAQIDGISGIVIGNVFKVEKNKLPKGYQADDIAFVVMGESQKITSGQDWTTEINGQLVLLDLPEQTGGTENATDQTGESTNTTQETSTEEKNQLDEADKTVGNTGLTQEEIDAGKLETTNRKVNGHTPYEYAYLIQAAQAPSNGAISEEFAKGNTAKVNEINELVELLEEEYSTNFQYNFTLNDFPKLDNQNVGSAYPSYELWIQGFTQYFPELKTFTPKQPNPIYVRGQYGFYFESGGIKVYAYTIDENGTKGPQGPRFANQQGRDTQTLAIQTLEKDIFGDIKYTP